MPFYGNTHTTTSVTSLQTTLFRHEARDIFRNATNAAEEDAVIFTGSGTTAAVHKLINAMSLHRVCLSLIYRFGIELMVTFTPSKIGLICISNCITISESISCNSVYF